MHPWHYKHSRIDPLQNVLVNAYQCSKLLQFWDTKTNDIRQCKVLQSVLFFWTTCCSCTVTCRKSIQKSCLCTTEAGVLALFLINCNHAHTYFWRFFCVPLHSLNTAPVCFLCSLNRTGQPLSQGSSAALSVLQPPQSEKRGPLVYLKSLWDCIRTFKEPPSYAIKSLCEITRFDGDF